MPHEVDASVRDYIDGITPARRKRDAETLLALMDRVTGEPARLWGTIVGYGQYHYRYASGREGDTPAVSFAPRKAATTIYLVDGIEAHQERLDRLGPHTTGVGCLYLKDLAAVDLAVLEAIVRQSYETVTADMSHHSRDSGS